MIYCPESGAWIRDEVIDDYAKRSEDIRRMIDAAKEDPDERICPNCGELHDVYDQSYTDI